MRARTCTAPRASAFALPALLLLASPSRAQSVEDISFSVDWHGVLQGTPATAGPPITAADVLFPETGLPDIGPLAPPRIRFTGGYLGLVNYANCVGAGPGEPCGVEVDALSYGTDEPLPSDAQIDYRIFFSTDEYVVGEGGIQPPSIFSEGPVGDICADILTSVDLPPGPVPPGVPPDHRPIIDGNGMLSATGFTYPGLGITEPNVPGSGLPGNPFDLGDNVDALDIGQPADLFTDPVYYSLDGDFFDPRAGVANSGSAGHQGVFGGDVLVRQPGARWSPTPTLPSSAWTASAPQAATTWTP